MPGLSMEAIERAGEDLLSELCPDALISPRPIDFAEWADAKLEAYGICVVPVNASELGDRHAATDPIDYGDGITNILIERSHYTKLFAGDRQANMPRGTLAHEVPHAVLHVPVLRRRLKTADARLLLSRQVRRDTIPAFRDPEWQAWALAGCLAAPRRTIEMTNSLDSWELAEIYAMSEPFMRNHLRRLKLLV